jgi:hypothetical protein
MNDITSRTFAQPPAVDPTESLQKRGERLYQVTTQIGCGIKRFEKTGRAQLEGLIRHGLNPWDKLLDIGCGALCGGYWMMHFLNPGCYHGVEPNTFMFKAGVAFIPEPDLFDLKKPSFLHNDQYDFSGFGKNFDYFHAHSIWTHAPKKDIEKMLDGFATFTNPGARFLTSFKSPHLFRPDYKGDTWVGRCHESDDAGICRHSYKWIRAACEARGLTVTLLTGEKIHKQKWILIERNA